MSPSAAPAIGRACAKVILLGEHAVVYGTPAIAVGIDRGARATSTAIEGDTSRLRVSGWEVEVTEADAHQDLGRAFAAVLEATRRRTTLPRALRVVVEADVPPGGGLGCSAAIGVAVARALDPRASDLEASDRAGAWERVFHGNPSGIDAAVATGGGCIYFQKGQPIERLRARAPLVLCVGHSGLASSTRAMVESVARLRERRPEVVSKAFEGIASLVRNARLALEAGDRFALGRLIDLNQMILSGLFVSCEEIETMCELARRAGALGAKLTGAGGGGSVVALAPGGAEAEAILAAWKAGGFAGFLARVGTGEPAHAVASEVTP
jgi:mevalonate kinase